MSTAYFQSATTSKYCSFRTLCGTSENDEVLLIAVSEELYKVYDATAFFTDMHRILRIVSLGNVRTVCHHRLKLLEQVTTISLEICWILT